MAITSTGSAEVIAVSSIRTYDLYWTYLNPEPNEKVKANKAILDVILKDAGIISSKEIATDPRPSGTRCRAVPNTSAPRRRSRQPGQRQSCAVLPSGKRGSLSLKKPHRESGGLSSCEGDSIELAIKATRLSLQSCSGSPEVPALGTKTPGDSHGRTYFGVWGGGQRTTRLVCTTSLYYF